VRGLQGTRQKSSRNFGIRLSGPTFEIYNVFMKYVYVIQNTSSKELYVGYTTNLKRRLIEHNGNGKKFTTRKNGEWVIIYVEAYRSESNARQREDRIKHNGNTKKELFKRINKCLFV
jgi:putative endonuclease